MGKLRETLNMTIKSFKETTAICAGFTILVSPVHKVHSGISYRCIFVTNKELNMQGMGADEQVIYSHVCKKTGMDLLCRMRLIMTVSCGPPKYLHYSPLMRYHAWPNPLAITEHY